MERKPASAKSRTRLSSVANSLRLIKAFSEDEYEIGISDLAKRLGLAKSTVHRLASTLLQAGILEQNSGAGKNNLGPALFALGARVRRGNYAVDDEESEIGLRAIAAPIRIYSGNVVAAISIAGPVHRMARKALLGWVRELVEAADAVSQRLGWQPARAEALNRRA